ncbi:MAG TPA: hypothetical protein VGG22_05120 [Candidatus Baltobacteraceae bacterium]|jgi:hypothetical protein
MARSCAFCGKDKVTNEHVFAKWVRNEFRSKRGVAILDFEKDEKLAWSHGGKPLVHKVKFFCASCNNGWMSRLEVSAGKILRPMLNAEHVGIKMGYADQLTVASWAVKTAMVCQHLHPSENFIPESYYRDFYKRKQPSSNVYVLIGARHKAEHIFEYKERFIGYSQTVGIQHVHFAIGALYLGMEMFIGRRRQYPSVMNDAAAERALQVWPVQPRDVIWPSESINEVGGIEGMFAAFSSAIWS